MAFAQTCSTCLAMDLPAIDFGVKADAKNDDGPAIVKMVEAARALEGPVRLVFPERQTVYAATGVDRYLFQLRETRGITIDGGGSTFVLHPDIRFADLDHSRSLSLKNFNVDFAPHPFIETVIEEVDPTRQFVEVRLLHPDEASALGGPTKQDGEQWFGGFVWCENGEHPKAAKHYSVRSVEQLPSGRVRVFYGGSAFAPQMASRIKPGATRFSVPRPGVAHRHGPGALFNIPDAVGARLENISVWGAPWFVFSIHRNEGNVEFLNVDVVPKPGSDRLMSACRDAFHVTGNRGKLLFDGCDTAGLGDDDYNFCILSSVIQKVMSPTEIVIKQKFPIQYNPMRVGETLIAMDRGNSVIGTATIAVYEEQPHGKSQPVVPPGGRYCPEVRIVLKAPIDGLAEGLTVWTKEAANPDTTMRNCTASFSIRMQTSLTVERCRFLCYNIAYGEDIEGPGPERIRIVDSEFLVGRGAGFNVQCGGSGPADTWRTREIVIERCEFRAPLSIQRARKITLADNRFYGDVTIGEHEQLEMVGNTCNGKPFDRPGGEE